MSILEAISPTSRTLLKKERVAALPHFDAVAARVKAETHNAAGSFILLDYDDDRLIHAAKWLAQIGDDCLLIACATPEFKPQNEANLKYCLTRLAAFCLLWLTLHERTLTRGLGAIRRERERQVQLFRDRKISFDVASAVPDNRRKFRVLCEEIGEVAQECDKLERTSHERAARQFLNDELVQVAAVCVARLEALEGRR